ncbi:pilus assembly protein, partial [Escherichia coli]
SSSFEEKNQNLQETRNRIYTYGGMSGMAIGVLSLLARNAALPLKETLVESYFINSVNGFAERLTSFNKEHMSENEAL